MWSRVSPVERCASASVSSVALALAISSLVISPTSALGQCSNEALRSELRSGALPDCRAYELVTPVYKEGVDLTGEFAISQDGSHLIGSTTGVFAGAESGQLGSSNLIGVTYEFSRTASGWRASSLAPSASQFNNYGMYDASADLSASLWDLGTYSQVFNFADFYLESPGGTFTRIGPATPSPVTPNVGSFKNLGASADLSHVLFTASPGFRWPFDSTAGGSTVYEYVGTENTVPMLVGVNGGRGSTTLVSKCGTRLGSSDTSNHFGTVHGSTYNAISSNGGRVFFTAIACSDEGPAVDELFAREEVSPSQSRTVAISEPNRQESCNLCQISGIQLGSAEFQGASGDGSKVFFSTEQELLPGGKGNNLYEYNFNAPEGSRISLISPSVSGEARVEGVARISEDGSHVYFVAAGRLAGENAEHQHPVAGKDNLYVYMQDGSSPGGYVSFVATLSPEDGDDWQQEDERPVQASRDGRFFVFLSHADLTHEGTSAGKAQVFQYDDRMGNLVRASIGQGGYNDDYRTPVFGPTVSTGAISAYGYANRDSPTMADGVLAPEDGAVFFESPDALTPQALNDELSGAEVPVPNIYEYHAGNIYLVSDGRDTATINGAATVHLLGSDGAGNNLFFSTSDSLIPEDTDTQQDFYDARVEGGFPPTVDRSSCTGDVCQGGLNLSPTGPPPSGSATQAPEDDQTTVVSGNTGETKLIPKQKEKKKGKKTRKKHARKSSHSANYKHRLRR
jgi:hypothetical protein